MTNDDLNSVASNLAKKTFEDDFKVRRHLGIDSDHGLLCFTDNNPYANDPTRRDREHVAIHAALASVGATRRASASYPLDGDDAGYTVAHVYECTDPYAAIEMAKSTIDRVVFGMT